MVILKQYRIKVEGGGRNPPPFPADPSFSPQNSTDLNFNDFLDTGSL